MAPEQQAENTLKEAFPSIDAAVVKAVLRASGGKVEPAFNALLGKHSRSFRSISSIIDDVQACQIQMLPNLLLQLDRRGLHRWPQALLLQRKTSWQLTNDTLDNLPNITTVLQPTMHLELGEEMFSRVALLEAPLGLRNSTRTEIAASLMVCMSSLMGQTELTKSIDELPIIRDNIKKGFLETQLTVNKWVNTLKKKMDGDDEDDFRSQPAQGAYVPQQQQGGRRSGDFGRRSTDRERYDADPQVLGDDFAGLQMKDNEGMQKSQEESYRRLTNLATPRRSSRPLANPDLFKPTPPRPRSTQSGRRVSFQDGPPEEIDIHYPRSPDPTNRPSSGAGGKSNKWQPLAAVDPAPVEDHDPFSLGDSDDDESKKKDVKSEDSERLKQAAAEAMSENISSPGDKKLEQRETSGPLGTRDKETDKLVGMS